MARLKINSTVAGKLIASTNYVNGEISSLDNRFLRKDQSDTLTGSLTTTGDITVGGGELTISKSGTDSIITFPAQTNDPGFIKHYESNNDAYMQFAVSDNLVDSDYFTFGTTTAEGARITAKGLGVFKNGLDITGGGNLRVYKGENRGIRITDNADESEKHARIDSVYGDDIIVRTSQLRLGESSSAWDWNQWAGLKYIGGTTKTLYIGGPASSQFTANTSPPTVKVSFTGTSSVETDSSLSVGGTLSTTGGAILTNNGGLTFKSSGTDPGDIVFTSSDDTEYARIYSESTPSLRFSTGTNTDAQMTISGSSVGIGTTDPDHMLHIYNNGGTGTTFYADVGNYSGTQTLFEHTGDNAPVPFRLKKSGYSGSSSDYGLLRLHMDHNVAGGGSNLYFTLDNASGSEIEYGGIGAIIEDNTAGAEKGSLLLYTSKRKEAVRVLDNGNVGIGNSSPEQKLDVTGVVRASGGIGITNANWLSFDTYGGGFYMADTTWIRTAGSKSFYHNTGAFRTDGTLQVGGSGSTLNVLNGGDLTYRTDTLVATTGGKVGVGTSSPEHPLHVLSGTTHQGINLQSGDNTLTQGLSFQNSGGAYAWHIARVNQTAATNTADLVFYGQNASNAADTTLSNLVERVRFNYNGGIVVSDRGTTIGGSNLDNAWLLIGTSTSGIGIDDNEIYSKGGDVYFGTADANALRLMTGATDRIFIASTGEVGVGTTSPTISLAIGDTNTGLDWKSDGNMGIYANNVEIAYWNSTKIDSSVPIYMNWNNIETLDSINSEGGDLSVGSNGAYLNVYSEASFAGTDFIVNNTNAHFYGALNAYGDINADRVINVFNKFNIEYNNTEDSLDFVYRT